MSSLPAQPTPLPKPGRLFAVVLGATTYVFSFWPWLTEILDERGITQTKLSEMSGVPQGSISRFDKNNRHEDAHLFAIARALGLKVEDLFDIEEEPRE